MLPGLRKHAIGSATKMAMGLHGNGKCAIQKQAAYVVVMAQAQRTFRTPCMHFNLQSRTVNDCVRLGTVWSSAFRLTTACRRNSAAPHPMRGLEQEACVVDLEINPMGVGIDEPVIQAWTGRRSQGLP